MQTYHFRKVKVHFRLRCRSIARCKRLEILVHRNLYEKRIRGEWFDLNASECESAIKAVAERYRDMTIEQLDALIGRYNAKKTELNDFDPTNTISLD